MYVYHWTDLFRRLISLHLEELIYHTEPEVYMKNRIIYVHNALWNVINKLIVNWFDIIHE